MTTRFPNKRHIGDGVYAGHDGFQVTLETCDGIQVTNRIGLENTALDGLNRYIQYAQEFYATDQHQVPPGCESCGADITDHRNPIPGALTAEVYHIQLEDARHEIRLCHECAHTADQPLLITLIAKRPSQAEPAEA